MTEELIQCYFRKKEMSIRIIGKGYLLLEKYVFELVIFVIIFFIESRG